MNVNELVQRAVALEGQPGGCPNRARDAYIQAVEVLLAQLQTTSDALERSTITNRANALLRAAEALPHGVVLVSWCSGHSACMHSGTSTTTAAAT